MAKARNEEAIRGWFAVHRPDVKSDVLDNLLSEQRTRALISMGFEAGRHLQAEYPWVDPMNVAFYDPTKPIPARPTPEPSVPIIEAPKVTTVLEPNVDGPEQIEYNTVWIHRRTKDQCTVLKSENGIVTVADSFGDARGIPEYMFRQSYNPKEG